MKPKLKPTSVGNVGKAVASGEAEAGKALITFMTSDAAVSVIKAKGW